MAKAGERMQGEETIFPRMFLSMEAERLIRSFNCDAVYSQPVRIAQPVPPPVGGMTGVGMGRRTGAGDGGGRERGPRAVLSEMWETDYMDGGGLSRPVKSTYPPLEPAPSGGI